MSYNVNFDTVANSISNVALTGITILDLDEIPVNALMVCPVLFPRPDGYVSNLTVTNNAFGSGAAKPITLEYDLTYVYAHCPIGANLDFGVYNGMVSNSAAIMSKFIESDAIAGVTDLTIGAVTFGPVVDPAGNSYHGCEVVFHIQQFGEI
jgi:hypothetical protein